MKKDEMRRADGQHNAQWHNFIICKVNNNEKPKKSDKFDWDKEALGYYKRLVKQKADEEKKMKEKYGEVLFPVAFEPWESDT